MSSELYKLYRKNVPEIAKMVGEMIDNAPLRPIFGFNTQEEEEQYNKELNEYLNKIKPEIIVRFKKMGFEVSEDAL